MKKSVHLSDFNPLPPCGGRHCRYSEFLDGDNISIHSLRVEGDIDKVSDFARELPISIHSLRVEGDCWMSTACTFLTSISIHSLRVEGDLPSVPALAFGVEFQSTPSVWRETP